jgi:hypothetical protein
MTILWRILRVTSQHISCSVDLLLADDSTKHALGRIDNVIIELHMNFVPIVFIIMDMRSNT